MFFLFLSTKFVLLVAENVKGISIVLNAIQITVIRTIISIRCLDVTRVMEKLQLRKQENVSVKNAILLPQLKVS